MYTRFAEGTTCYISIAEDTVDGLIVAKREKYGTWIDSFKREALALEMLKDFDWAPNLHDIDLNTATILMYYSGVSLEKVPKDRWPKDFLAQAKKICDDMASIKFNHNDVKRHNITLKDGKISLIDFGYCSLTSEVINPEGQLGYNDFSLGDPSISNTTPQRHAFPDKCDWEDFKFLERYRLGEIELEYCQ